MTLRFPWWIYVAVAGLLILAGWCGHAATTQPADEATLRTTDSLRATRDAFNRERAERRALEDSLLLIHEARQAQAEAAAREAARLRATAQAARAAVQTLGLGLAQAHNAADSLPILVEQKRQLLVVLDTLEAANDSLEHERIRLTADKARLLVVIGSLQTQRTADSARLVIQDGLLDTYRKSASPCQRWCPTVVGNYEVREKAISLGAGIRYKIFTLSATYQVQ